MLWSDLGIQARQYLINKRGLSEAGIRDLGLGFFSSYSEVIRVLRDKGFYNDEINSVNLKSLEGYITYPWLDANSRPLTIYGRWHSHIPPNGKSKVIGLYGKSTKRSPLYLDRALKNHHKTIVLVEGVNDAAVAQSQGLTDVCAYLAASCSGEQIETLKRKRVEKVILCGDPDGAGEKGTVSNLNRMTEKGISVHVAPLLPDNLDPDEFILKYGKEAWHRHIEQSQHGFRWLARKLINQFGADTDSKIEKLLKVAVDWTVSVPNSMSKELDTFFWSKINQHTGAFDSGKIHQTIIQLREEKKPVSVQEETSTDFNQTEFLKQAISKVIETGANDAEIELSIQQLADQCGRSSHDIRQLFKALGKQLDREENQDLHNSEITSLLKISKEDIYPEKYLPEQLAAPLKQIAIYLGVNNASLLTTLLTVSASLIPINTCLKLIEATDFNAYPILYTGICAESGSGKSPLIKVIINSLSQLQLEEEKRYKLELTAYEEAYRQWKKSKNAEIDAPSRPKLPREYFITDATSEAIANIQNNQPNNGFIGWFDELTALMGQQNAYRGGKGSDAEKILSGRDGTGFKINRAGRARINCTRSGYSILGGIQPDILKKHMGDFSDPSGFWARFIWVNLPIVQKPYPTNSAKIEVNDLLCSLYKKLGTIKVSSFQLSSDAQIVFKQWYERSEDLKIAEPRQALRSVYAKSQKLSGELALILHCINYSLNQKEPPQEVQIETMQAAVKLTEFYISQVQLIHANSNASEDNLSSSYFKIIDLSNRKGWIKARDVQNSIRSFKKISPNRIRSIFKELEADGRGATKFDGKKLIWKADNSVDLVDGM